MKTSGKKPKYNVAMFHEFLVLKGDITQIMDKLIPQELNKEYERGIQA